MFGKDERDKTQSEDEAEKSSEYYYDDSTGYRIYKPENGDEDVSDGLDGDE